MSSKGNNGILSNFDAFSKSIGLTIRGRDTYKSNCGGLATLSIFMLVIGYMMIIVTQPLKYKASISTTTTTTVISNTTNANNTTSSGSPSTNSSSPGNITIGGIDYVGTYSTKKSNLYHNITFDANSYYPQNNSLMFAVDFAGSSQNFNQMFFEFYVASPNENGTGIDYEFIPQVACTSDMFPPSLADEFEYYSISSSFVCPNLTDVNLVSDRYGSNYKYLEIETRLCSSSSCEDNNFTSTHNYDKMRVFVSEGYYDPTDQDNPVKYKLNTRISVLTKNSYLHEKSLRIKQNQVKKLDGSTVNFSSIEYQDVDSFYPRDLDSYQREWTYRAACYIELSDNYDYYEMYVDYQPVIDSSRRHLNTPSNEQELISGEYFVFYIMAQMGGLYSFLILILSVFVNHYNKQAFNHTTINEVYKVNIMKDVKDRKYGIGSSNYARYHTRKVMPVNNREVKLGDQSIFKENDSLTNHQMCPPDENIYQNNSKTMFNRHSVNNDQNHEEYQMHDGGDEMEELQRRKNDVEQHYSAYYDYNDLLYSVFCCNRGNMNKSRRSRAGRNGHFKNELDLFDEERDLVNIITFINTMKTQICAIEEKLEHMQAIQQAASIPEPVIEESKESTNSGSNVKSEQKHHPVTMTKRKSKGRNTKMKKVSKQTKTNASHGMPEETKAPSGNGEYAKNTARAQTEEQEKPEIENGPISQIVDDNEHKSISIKGNLRSSDQTVNNEMQDISNQKKDNKEKPNVNITLIEQPEYETNQVAIGQQQPIIQTRDPSIAEVQTIQLQLTLPGQTQPYNFALALPVQWLNPATHQLQPQVHSAPPDPAPIINSQAEPHNNQELDLVERNKQQDRFDPNIDYYRAQTKDNLNFYKFQ